MIDGWYDEVEKLSDKEIQKLETELFDSDSFKEYGIDKFVNNIAGFEIKKSLGDTTECIFLDYFQDI